MDDRGGTGGGGGRAQVPVTARVELGGIDPADVVVEAFYSSLHADGSLGTGRSVRLELTSQEDGRYLYRGTVPARASGLHGYAVRVLPRHEDVLVPQRVAAHRLGGIRRSNAARAGGSGLGGACRPAAASRSCAARLRAASLRQEGHAVRAVRQHRDGQPRVFATRCRHKGGDVFHRLQPGRGHVGGRKTERSSPAPARGPGCAPAPGVATGRAPLRPTPGCGCSPRRCPHRGGARRCTCRSWGDRRRIPRPG